MIRFAVAEAIANLRARPWVSTLLILVAAATVVVPGAADGLVVGRLRSQAILAFEAGSTSISVERPSGQTGNTDSLPRSTCAEVSVDSRVIGAIGLKRGPDVVLWPGELSTPSLPSWSAVGDLDLLARFRPESLALMPEAGLLLGSEAIAGLQADEFYRVQAEVGEVELAQTTVLVVPARVLGGGFAASVIYPGNPESDLDLCVVVVEPLYLDDVLQSLRASFPITEGYAVRLGRPEAGSEPSPTDRQSKRLTQHLWWAAVIAGYGITMTVRLAIRTELGFYTFLGLSQPGIYGMRCVQTLVLHLLGGLTGWTTLTMLRLSNFVPEISVAHAARAILVYTLVALAVPPSGNAAQAVKDG